MSTNDAGTTGPEWIGWSLRRRTSIFERALESARVGAAEAARARKLSEIRLWLALYRKQRSEQNAR